MKKGLFLPFLLFAGTLLLDHLITQRGLAAGLTEGNVVVIWLWKVLPIGPHLIALLWGVLVTMSALLLVRCSVHVGRWFLYTAFVGRLSGCLSWTPVLHESVQRVWEIFGHRWGLVFLLACAGVGGIILAFLHHRWMRRTWR